VGGYLQSRGQFLVGTFEKPKEPRKIEKLKLLRINQRPFMDLS